MLKDCLNLLKSDDIRTEIKAVFSPVTDAILGEIYPYIYVIVVVVLLIFAMLTSLLLMVAMLWRGGSK